MKIAIFCAGDPRHIYFANKLCGHLPISRIFVEEKPSIYDGGRMKREADFFFGSPEGPSFDRNELVLRINDINCTDVESYLSSEINMLICTFGCSIIKMESAFRKGIDILNLHSGILPEYRGVHCVFWALYNREPDMVGGSIHLINRRIDAGEIMAKVFPAVSREDNEETLFNKVIKLGVDEFTQAAGFIYTYGSPVSQPQRLRGRIYFVQERTEARELELDAMLRDGLLEEVHCQKRIERFYEKAGEVTQPKGGCGMAA